LESNPKHPLRKSSASSANAPCLPLLAKRLSAECKECGQPLIEVDNRGQHLRGCLTCNEWHDRHGNLVRLSEEDLATLHSLRGK
jgi:hypothetical protein